MTISLPEPENPSRSAEPAQPFIPRNSADGPIDLSMLKSVMDDVYNQAMETALADLDHVSKNFGDLQVLDQLSFDVTPGERLASFCPSGLGKTNILRILMALEAIDDEHIRLDGDELWHMPKNGGLIACG